MTVNLTVRDLLLDGGPLSPAEVVVGDVGLDNAVSWAVSLRPYAPAFPRLRGGELALVASENLARLDLPPSLSEVIQQLSKLNASAVAVKGDVDEGAIQAARELSLPLILLAPDAPMHDIEQAVMRECAMRHALAEMRPRTGAEWLAELLSGEDVVSEAPKEASSHIDRAATYVIAYIANSSQYLSSTPTRATRRVAPTEIALSNLGFLHTPLDSGIAVLLPEGEQGKLIAKLESMGGVACGIGTAQPLRAVVRSLEEAKLAATASALLRECAPTLYSALGADRLLLLLRRDAPEQLRSFVEETLGAILEHDARSATSLLPTLQAFIEHGGKLRETAAALYVHRNSLAYRLERATRIAGLDPRDPQERLALEIALRGWRLTH